MQVQAINKRAQQRYGSFVTAMNTVNELLQPFERLIREMRETKSPRGGWRNATPDELTGMLKKAYENLTELREQAKRYEIELVSRDWRV